MIITVVIIIITIKKNEIRLIMIIIIGVRLLRYAVTSRLGIGVSARRTFDKKFEVLRTKNKLSNFVSARKSEVTN